MDNENAIRSVILFGITLLLATPALGASIGASFGSVEYVDFCEGAFDCDDTDTAYKFYVSGAVNENFRIEGFWADFGEVEGSALLFGEIVTVTGAIDGFGIDAMFVGGSTVQFFAKLGLLFWDFEATLEIDGDALRGDDDGSDPFIGLGASIPLGEAARIRFEWEQFDIDGEDLNLLSGGVEFDI